MSIEEWWTEICGRGKREKPREKPTLTPFRPPRNPHGVIETRTRDPSSGRRAPNRLGLRHEAARDASMISNLFVSHCDIIFNVYLFFNNNNAVDQEFFNTRTIVCVCVCVPMPTHCTITRFGFHARWIDDVKCGLFSNHAPLGQTTLRVGGISV